VQEQNGKEHTVGKEWESVLPCEAMAQTQVEIYIHDGTDVGYEDVIHQALVGSWCVTISLLHNQLAIDPSGVANGDFGTSEGSICICLYASLP